MPERAWLDVVTFDREAGRRLLQDELGFHELAVEDALSDQERPALQEFGDVTFLVLPVPVGGLDNLRFLECAFFFSEHGLVTVNTEALPIVDAVFNRWLDCRVDIGEHPAFLVHLIVDAIVDSYFPLIDLIEDRSDELTDSIFQGDTTRMPEIMALKKRLLEVRRSVAPMRDVIGSLLRRDLHAVPRDAKPFFQDVFDHVLRIGELVDSNRETLASMLDVHLSSVSNSLNVVLKKMTILSTVLMTMALVAGIYGMNFKVMPELEWAYGYPFALGLMVTLAAVIVLVFKRVKWL